MSAPKKHPIGLVLEDDGSVLIEAAGVIAWLRECADAYGSGKKGGLRLLRKGAQLALDEVADSLQEACIDKSADAVLEKWRPMP